MPRHSFFLRAIARTDHHPAKQFRVDSYWCYGTQLSVNASTTSDFWGTKNAGINYGLLFTAWGVAGIVGPRIGGALFDKYQNYEAAFYTAAALAAVALLCELLARRPAPVEFRVEARAAAGTRA